MAGLYNVNFSVFSVPSVAKIIRVNPCKSVSKFFFCGRSVLGLLTVQACLDRIARPKKVKVQNEKLGKLESA